jgi:hypothetical protein
MASMPSQASVDFRTEALYGFPQSVRRFHLFSLRLFSINHRNFTHRRRGLDYKWTKGGEGGGWIS